ncbi:syntaxin-6-like [Symsagittifera roscoffensis]|uniref:syntaxin-6-like n=1 Tax=Symsagittifera roscoffensis TaxID=84072 RepID=UPI00307CA080
MEDPYFIVKSDVERALENLTKLHDSFNKSQSNSHSNGFKEINDIRGEIKTALRDVQYDIEDIEETVRIVEANPKKFKINSNEINSRKQFIEASKDKLKIVDAAIRNAKTTNGVTNDFSKKKKQSSYAKTSKSGSNNVKYSKLESYHDEENDKFISNTVNEQQQLLHRQDEEIDRVTTSIGVLKSMSRQIGDELDDQNEALDDLHHEMDSTSSKMDNVMKKLAKVTRLSDDKRQWTAIFVLSITILILFLLLVIL